MAVLPGQLIKNHIVVIGNAGNQSITCLLYTSGLEKVPPLLVPYKGIDLRELNLDAVLRRKPQLVLVDELAHTNAAGMRHRKRYEDIEEILDAGIDVYTTVNIQHLESLNDIVGSITGIHVRERVPDKIFDSANQVKLVDIEPDILIERLKEGKIYKAVDVYKRQILDLARAQLNTSNLRQKFSEDDHLVICIGRTQGSAGNDIGFALADALRINYYEMCIRDRCSAIIIFLQRRITHLQ